MDRQITYEIEKDYKDVWSFFKEKKYPKAVRTQLKENPKQVLKNGEETLLYMSLKKGDILQITIREKVKSSLNLIPLKMPLDIVYEDDDLLVINKPSGLSIHPSQKHYEDSLANAVLYYLGQRGEEIVFRCVNRLDKETSGLTIVAKNMLAAAVLSEEIRYREIKREYRALVCGEMEVDGNWHTVDAPIGRVEGSAILRCVDEKGKPAVTHYQVLESKDGYSILKLRLDTGRTHQIRIHMKHIGHPLPGDYLYHPVYDKVDRVPLHSYSLEFLHPITFEYMRFESGTRDSSSFQITRNE